jgi:hypothetical protein
MTLKLGLFLPQNFSYDPHGSLVEAARMGPRLRRTVTGPLDA